MSDQENIERAVRLRRMMNEYLRNRTPQERDRIMQVYLAQARGPVRNVMLLCDMTGMLLRARKIALAKEQKNVQS
ncbi:MAG: hypothetical protein ACYTFA_05045 [Planctomycetota bacterium]|jgi:hypothetical protein